jgi:GntR family transcriptional regulator
VSHQGRGYRQIADFLRAGIQRGDYPPGDTLPRQEFLAEQWGVNRGTVRRAVNLLHAEGMVDPTPGVGTIVRDLDVVPLPIERYRQTTPDAGPWEVACTIAGIVGNTDVTEVGWLPADTRIARELNVEPHTPVCRRRNRMSAGHRVMQIQETWLPKWVAADTALSRPEKLSGGIYRALADLGHILTSATETVRSRMPTASESETFGLRLGSSVMDARRTTRNDTGSVLVHTHVVVTEGVCFVYSQRL